MKTLNKKPHLGLIMTTYLLGIFMGAIDTGIVSPARTIIQNDFSVGDKTGIWMITIYTLAYAASIPIMGKLADKFGRKYVYLTSILLFGTGSLFCGLSQIFGGFQFLLIARAIQAVGGGGILPVATAEFGTTFPKEKRGMALGLVGGVYGIANIFGASAGSAILDVFGTGNWQFIFYINIPITLFILVAGFFCLQNNKSADVKRIDIRGITILTIMVLSLLYGLKNIDFFAFGTSFISTSVYPFLIVFIVLLPLFLLAEKKAEDPVLNLSYFRIPKIIIILILSFITGIVIMGMIFVPQFSENALKRPSGSGGYFVIILGVFAGIGAPVSGKLIDKFGVKLILGFGFLASVLGSLYLILVTANYPNMFNVVVSLMITGVGIGFTMGTPLNYMMLDNTNKEESNSALATVSLIRSIGTAIAPAIMIGFIAHAGLAVQTNVMNLLPKTINVPPLPYAQELTDDFEKLKEDPKTKDKFADFNIPDLASMKTIQISMSSNSGYVMPKDLVDLMKKSDVTNITANTKTLTERMFAEMIPGIVSKIENGIDSGISGMTSAMNDMDKTITDMQNGYDGIGKGIAGMTAGVEAQQKALRQLESATVYMNLLPEFLSNTLSGTSFSIVTLMPQSVKDQMPQSVLEELSKVKSAKDLNNKISDLKSAINTLSAKIESTKTSQAELFEGLNAVKAAKEQMGKNIVKMQTLKDAVPGAFVTAKSEYIAEIDNSKDALENEFQSTLNGGFKQVYLTVAVASFSALMILMMYRLKKD